MNMKGKSVRKRRRVVNMGSLKSKFITTEIRDIGQQTDFELPTSSFSILTLDGSSEENESEGQNLHSQKDVKIAPSKFLPVGKNFPNTISTESCQLELDNPIEESRSENLLDEVPVAVDAHPVPVIYTNDAKTSGIDAKGTNVSEKLVSNGSSKKKTVGNILRNQSQSFVPPPLRKTKRRERKTNMLPGSTLVHTSRENAQVSDLYQTPRQRVPGSKLVQTSDTEVNNKNEYESNKMDNKKLGCNVNTYITGKSRLNPEESGCKSTTDSSQFIYLDDGQIYKHGETNDIKSGIVYAKLVKTSTSEDCDSSSSNADTSHENGKKRSKMLKNQKCKVKRVVRRRTRQTRRKMNANPSVLLANKFAESEISSSSSGSGNKMGSLSIMTHFGVDNSSVSDDTSNEPVILINENEQITHRTVISNVVTSEMTSAKGLNNANWINSDWSSSKNLKKSLEHLEPIEPQVSTSPLHDLSKFPIFSQSSVTGPEISSQTITSNPNKNYKGMNKKNTSKTELENPTILRLLYSEKTPSRKDAEVLKDTNVCNNRVLNFQNTSVTKSFTCAGDQYLSSEHACQKAEQGGIFISSTEKDLHGLRCNMLDTVSNVQTLPIQSSNCSTSLSTTQGPRLGQSCVPGLITLNPIAETNNTPLRRKGLCSRNSTKTTTSILASHVSMASTDDREINSNNKIERRVRKRKNPVNDKNLVELSILGFDGNTDLVINKPDVTLPLPSDFSNDLTETIVKREINESSNSDSSLEGTPWKKGSRIMPPRKCAKKLVGQMCLTKRRRNFQIEKNKSGSPSQSTGTCENIISHNFGPQVQHCGMKSEHPLPDNIVGKENTSLAALSNSDVVSSAVKVKSQTPSACVENVSICNQMFGKRIVTRKNTRRQYRPVIQNSFKQGHFLTTRKELKQTRSNLLRNLNVGKRKKCIGYNNIEQLKGLEQRISLVTKHLQYLKKMASVYGSKSVKKELQRKELKRIHKDITPTECKTIKPANKKIVRNLFPVNAGDCKSPMMIAVTRIRNPGHIVKSQKCDGKNDGKADKLMARNSDISRGIKIKKSPVISKLKFVKKIMHFESKERFKYTCLQGKLKNLGSRRKLKVLPLLKRVFCVGKNRVNVYNCRMLYHEKRVGQEMRAITRGIKNAVPYGGKSALNTVTEPEINRVDVDTTSKTKKHGDIDNNHKKIESISSDLSPLCCLGNQDNKSLEKQPVAKTITCEQSCNTSDMKQFGGENNRREVTVQKEADGNKVFQDAASIFSRNDELNIGNLYDMEINIEQTASAIGNKQMNHKNLNVDVTDLMDAISEPKVAINRNEDHGCVSQNYVNLHQADDDDKKIHNNTEKLSAVEVVSNKINKDTVKMLAAVQNQNRSNMNFEQNANMNDDISNEVQINDFTNEGIDHLQSTDNSDVKINCQNDYIDQNDNVCSFEELEKSKSNFVKSDDRAISRTDGSLEKPINKLEDNLKKNDPSIDQMVMAFFESEKTSIQSTVSNENDLFNQIDRDYFALRLELDTDSNEAFSPSKNTGINKNGSKLKQTTSMEESGMSLQKMALIEEKDELNGDDKESKKAEADKGDISEQTTCLIGKVDESNLIENGKNDCSICTTHFVEKVQNSFDSSKKLDMIINCDELCNAPHSANVATENSEHADKSSKSNMVVMLPRTTIEFDSIKSSCTNNLILVDSGNEIFKSATQDNKDGSDRIKDTASADVFNKFVKNKDTDTGSRLKRTENPSTDAIIMDVQMRETDSDSGSKSTSETVQSIKNFGTRESDIDTSDAMSLDTGDDFSEEADNSNGDAEQLSPKSSEEITKQVTFISDTGRNVSRTIGEKVMANKRRSKNSNLKGKDCRGAGGWEESLRQKPPKTQHFQVNLNQEKKTGTKTQSKNNGDTRKNENICGNRKNDKPRESTENYTFTKEVDMSLSDGGSTDLSQIATEPSKVKTIGRIVFAKLGRERWWPGLTISGDPFGIKDADFGKLWIFWFGDHKISQILEDKVIPFVANYSKMVGKKMGKLFHKGIVEGIQICASRCGKEFLNEQTLDRDLLNWANEGFHVPVDHSVNFCQSPFDPKEGQSLPDFVVEKLYEISDNISKDSDDEMDVKCKTRDNQDSAVELVKAKEKRLEDICISCDNVEKEIVMPHPLFKGGLCQLCKEDLVETLCAIGEDGSSVYCVICGAGGELFVCDNQDCYRAYCMECIEVFINEDAVTKIRNMNPWLCFLCSTYDDSTHGLIKPQADWQENLVKFFDTGYRVMEPDLSYLNTQDKKPIKVLSLFDGIGTGKLILSQLGLEVEKYYSCEIDSDALLVTSVHHGASVRHLGDVTKLTDSELMKILPIDLIIGGSPCNDLSLANPARKGFEFGGTGTLFFEYYRILKTVQSLSANRHVFWLFENVASMKHEYRALISRFFQCGPALWDAKYFSAQARPRFFWGNIPGMYSTPQLSQITNSVSLDGMLSPHCNRKALVDRLRTITTRQNSLKIGKNDERFPISMNGKDDMIWISELERVFGFPAHYTDVGNLPMTRRQKLLGQSWSVPVVQKILSPLKKYFSSTQINNTEN